MSDTVQGDMLTTKVRSVLELADDQPFEGFATFEMEDDDDPEVWTKQYHMPAQDWEDFGRVKTITMTVRPGDLLNPPDVPDE